MCELHILINIDLKKFNFTLRCFYHSLLKLTEIVVTLN